MWGSLSFDRDVRVSFFETVIRLLGGLVSCYDLSGDPMFLARAVDLADRLMHAFHPTSGACMCGVWTCGCRVCLYIGGVGVERGDMW